MGIIFGYQKPGVIGEYTPPRHPHKTLISLLGTNNPAPGVFICADGDPPGQHWTAYYWTAILCIELILLMLSLHKAWVYRNAGNGLMQALTKGSVIYFVFIWWIYLANQILWLRNRVSQISSSFVVYTNTTYCSRLLAHSKRARNRIFLCHLQRHCQSAYDHRSPQVLSPPIWAR